MFFPLILLKALLYRISVLIIIYNNINIQKEKYSANSSSDALEEFMADVNTNNMYKFGGYVKTDAYVLISNDVKDRNGLH